MNSGDYGSGQEVLIVDDEVEIRALFATALGQVGFTVHVAEGVAGALAMIASYEIDVLVVDKNLADGDGLDIVRQLGELRPDSRSIMVTAHGTMESALAAMRLGVAGYLEKPLALDELHHNLRRIVEVQRLERDNHRLIEELACKNEALEGLAVRDPLTKLFNHGYLQECIEREVSRSRRNELEFSLLFVDLDNFKKVNDSLGHVVGDHALQRFASFLHVDRAEHDPGFSLRSQDIAARYGGDEFAVLLPETNQAGAAAKAEYLRAYVDNYDFARHDLPALKVSVGVASYPADATDRVALIEAADTALYAAKRASRNRVVTYSQQLVQMGDGEVPVSEIERLDALEASIASRHFDFVYQPIVRVPDGEVFAYEALCRPRHPAFLSPMSLIETAARAGRVSALGRVLRERSLAALDQLPSACLLFINLHPHEIHDPALVDVDLELSATAERVVFELTESCGIRDYSHLREVMDRLRGVGFRFALDDLGAGYSGLNSLALLAPDFVKLDMQLVRGVVNDKRTARLVRHVVEFAAAENIGVIAEGIESDAELDAVVELGCELVQGFKFGGGVPADEIAAASSRQDVD